MCGERCRRGPCAAAVGHAREPGARPFCLTHACVGDVQPPLFLSHMRRVQVLDTPAAVTAACDITVVMLADPHACRQVAFGQWGAVEGLGPGKGYIDASTVDAATSRAVGKAVAKTGAAFLEAPVSGSKAPAEQGQLIFMTAGAAHAPAERALVAFREREDSAGVAGCMMMWLRPRLPAPVPACLPSQHLQLCTCCLLGKTQHAWLLACAHAHPPRNPPGDEQLYQAAVPMLNAMGKMNLYLGPTGAAANMKLVINMIMVRRRGWGQGLPMGLGVGQAVVTGPCGM